MQEQDMSSNIRADVFKLLFRLREQWRTAAHNIGETTGNRAQFKDLVDVIVLVDLVDCHVRILSDPLFGNISDPPGNRP